MCLPVNPIITMLSHDPNYPLPNPVLLATHASVARILNMRGNGDYLEEILRDRDSIRCLATDGSTDISLLLPVC